MKSILKWGLCTCSALCYVGISSAQSAHTDTLLKNILQQGEGKILQNIIAQPNTYRLQIIYTAINRDKNNKPHFTNYFFNYNPHLYYNPASVVKLPLAALALEKLNNLKQHKVNKYTAMLFDSSYSKQTALYSDSTSETGLPSIAHFIKKAFLISDNDAFNRLYQFVGQERIHKSLWSKGYKNILIPRQFMGFTKEQNRHANAIKFIDAHKNIIYTQPASYNKDSLIFPDDILIGKAHYNRFDELIPKPMNFSGQNNIPLLDLQQILQSIIFPKSVPKKQRFNFQPDDVQFLRKFLSQFPSETAYPKYDSSIFYNSYVKFFFRNQTHQLPNRVRVFNKVGWSYGFLTDVSYIVDFENKIEYMLTATVYVNSDGILNDNTYDYDSLGYPFLYELGQCLYQYELKRSRARVPDLSNLFILYDKRAKNDKRPVIKEADN